MNKAQREDLEATQFAMELLMPADLVRAEYNRKPFDIGDSKALKAMADKFKVEVGVMAVRLGQLCRD